VNVIDKKNKRNTRERRELTQKLFHTCIALQAREEGFQPLKSLHSSHLSFYDEGKKFEGIRTEEVTQDIADFVHQVAGRFVFLIFDFNPRQCFFIF
jgi:hypothetical protein